MTKLPLKTRILNFLLEVESSKTVPALPSAPVEYVQDAPVPPINHRAVLIRKLVKGFQGGMNETEQWALGLEKLPLRTLQILEHTERRGELPDYFFHEVPAETANSVLVLLRQDAIADVSLPAMINGYLFLKKYHELGFDDLSTQDTLTLRRITAAVKVQGRGSAYASTPRGDVDFSPELTHFAMQHPELADEIVKYLDHYHPGGDNIDSIDFERLTEYLESDNKVLREGIL